MPTSVQVTSQPLIAKGTPAPSRVTSPSQIKSAKLPFSEALARDVEALSQNVNRLHSVLATNAPSMSRILLTDAQSGNVVAAFGDFLFQGKYYTNFLNEIHVGDPLLRGNPQNALFNANTDGSVTIGQNGWLDVLDPFGGQAAWLGTQNDTLAVTGAANNGSGAIRLTVPGHTLVTGNQVRVQDVGGVGQAPPSNGTFVNNATGVWSIAVVDASHIDLVGSVFAGAYTSGGVVDRVLQIAGAANNGSGLIRIQTAVAHAYMSGDQVTLAAVGGVPNANGQWIISVVDSTHFDLAGSTFAGAYTSGGTSLRYFAGMLAQTIAIGPSFANYKLREFADGSLRINNATITLSSPSGQILLDPTLPEISLTNTANPAKIKLDANPPSLTLYDQSGNAAVAVDVIEETALAITATSNGSPDVITAPGHTFVNGDTVHVSGAQGDTAINGYRIVENLSGTGGTFRLTDLNGTVINGNGSYTGGGLIARYYAGLVAQTVAIGQSFSNYKLRAFADGQLIIKGAAISSSSIDGSTTLNGSTINNATLNNPTITGSATGSGNLTEATSSVLTITGGTGAVLGTGTSIAVKQASASQSGYLLSTDWSTFNGKAGLAGTNTWTNPQTFNQTVTCGLSLRAGAFASSCRTVTTATDTCSLTTDHTLILNGVTTQSLPASPGGSGNVNFEYYFVNIGVSAVTIAGNGHNIYSAGVSAASISLPPAASIILQYDLTNTIWRQIAAPLAASATQSGILSSSDWSAFNAKQSALTLGNFTETTSAVLTITGGTGAVVGSGLSVQVKQASGAQSGYLSSTDWTTFNNKQASLGFVPLNPANNLSELTASAATARTNLGLGSAATQASTAFDAAGAAAALLSSANTWSAAQTHSSLVAISSGVGAPLLSVTEVGVGYGSSNAAIRVNTQNPTGTANYFYDGLLNGTSVYSVRADGFLLASGGLALTGFSNAPGTTSGALELGYDGTECVVQAYSRSASVYKPLWLNGSQIQFLIGGTEAARISNGSNLGVGTTNPLNKAHILGPAPVLDGSAATLRLDYDGGDAINSYGGMVVFTQRWQNLAGSVRVGAIAGVKTWPTSGFGGGLAFFSQPNSSSNVMNEVFRITGGSTMLIGTTTDNGTDKLQVSGAVNASGGFKVGTSSGASGTITIPKLTTANGSITVTNGIITAFTNPT